MGKRLFDLLLSGLGLLLLAPLLLALAWWIRLDSPGPALFRQERVGQHGRRFRIHKFRTMRTEAGGLPLTVGVDPRITRAGHFLRRHKLDELPQLIDVFKGDMSLVGPRPEVPRYVELYPAELREQALAVRPGITDPASLAHLDEAALLAAASDPERDYIERVLPAKLAAAVAYSQQATLGSDLRLLARTVWTLLTRPRTP